MRLLRHILLALVFLLQTSLVLAESMRTCCADDLCPVTQCMAMGCAVSAAPIAVGRSVDFPVAAAATVFASTALAPLPAPVEEIWTPPD